jgi:hypothetical protein
MPRRAKYRAWGEPDDDERSRFAANAATIKRGVTIRVDEIKTNLAQWLDESTTTPADHAAASVALLETAFDRYLDTYDEGGALELIDAAFRRAAQRRRGTPQ